MSHPGRSKPEALKAKIAIAEFKIRRYYEGETTRTYTAELSRIKHSRMNARMLANQATRKALAPVAVCNVLPRVQAQPLPHRLWKVGSCVHRLTRSGAIITSDWWRTKNAGISACPPSGLRSSHSLSTGQILSS